MVYFRPYHGRFEGEKIKSFSSVDEMKKAISNFYKAKELRIESNHSIINADDLVIIDGFVAGFCYQEVE